MKRHAVKRVPRFYVDERTLENWETFGLMHMHEPFTRRTEAGYQCALKGTASRALLTLIDAYRYAKALK